MIYQDNKINKKFEIVEMNISEVRDMLASKYLTTGIDVFNIEQFVKRVPYNKGDLTIKYNYEAYVFQSLSLLKTKDGYQLLDGFRRLFCTSDIDPNAKGIFYVFNEEDFTKEELFYLLTTLNQPKFIGSNGSFIDRGVALYLMYNYNVNVLAINNIITSYLTSNEIEFRDMHYGNNNVSFTNKNPNEIKERISDDKFLHNLLFMDALILKYPNLNQIHNIGAFIYHISESIVLDLDKIIFSDGFNTLYNEGKFGSSGSRELQKADALYQEFTLSVSKSYGLKTKRTHNEAMVDFEAIRNGIRKQKIKSYKIDETDDFDFMKLLETNGYKKPIIKVLRKPDVGNPSFDGAIELNMTINDITLYRNTFGALRYNVRNLSNNDTGVVIYDAGNIRVENKCRYKNTFYVVGFSDEKLNITDKTKRET